MSDIQNREIRAGLGFFNRPVVCRIAEDGLEIARGADVTRVGYDVLSGSAFTDGERVVLCSVSEHRRATQQLSD